MKIILIRHGEPDYELDTLTEKGWREAELLGQRLSRLDIDAIYTSPLGRARDTAAPTLQKLGRQAEVLPWLAEFRGTIYAPATAQKNIPWNLAPQYWTRSSLLYDKDRWYEQDLMQTGDVAKIYHETTAGLDELLAAYGYRKDGMLWHCDNNTTKTIVLFGHLALGQTIMGYLLGVAAPVLWHSFFMPASSVTTLITEERVKGTVAFRCQQTGDTSHLYAAGEPVSTAGLFPECHS